MGYSKTSAKKKKRTKHVRGRGAAEPVHLIAAEPDKDKVGYDDDDGATDDNRASQQAPLDGSTEAGPRRNNAEEDGYESSDSASADSYTTATSARPGAVQVYPLGRPTQLEELDNITVSGGDGTSATTTTPPSTTTYATSTDHGINIANAHLFDESQELNRRINQRLQQSMVVDGEHVSVTITSSDSYGDEKRQNHRRPSKYRKWSLVFVYVLVVAAAAAVVAVAFAPTKSEGSDPENGVGDDGNGAIKMDGVPISQDNGGEPTSPTDYWKLAKSMLSPIWGDHMSMIDNESSNQYKALDWLVNQDPANLLFTISNDQYEGSSNNIDASLTWSETTVSEITERYLMALLFYATEGPNWHRETWFLSNRTVCDWGRISCNDEESITAIQLYQLGLNGTIPSELGHLSNLEQLTLEGNQLQGTLPPSIGQLSQLRILTVSDNSMVGTIPTEFSNLRKLEILGLRDNKFSGTIPDTLFQLTSLEYIWMSSNFFNGSIPEFSQPNEATGSGLREIFLNSNQLEGSIPQSLYSLASLQVLFLQENFISGTLASEIGGLQELQVLHIYDNTFSGSIPSELGLLTDLVQSRIYLNNFNGTLPSEVGSMEKLEAFIAVANDLSGSLPPEIGEASLLRILQVGLNPRLGGVVPMSLLSLPSLQTIDLRGTNVTDGSGTIQTFCDKPDLVTEIWTDCAGNVTDMECPCCTVCYDQEAMTNEINLPARCKMYGTQFEHENGRFFDARRDTSCECNEEGNLLQCSDSSCPTCNEDGTVCALNTNYGFRLDEFGNTVGWTNGFDYVDVGGNSNNNDTATLDVAFSWNTEASCNVTVNHQQCRSCAISLCADDFRFFEIDCLVTENEYLNVCNDVLPGGSLTAFQAIEKRFASGCSPMFSAGVFDHWYGQS